MKYNRLQIGGGIFKVQHFNCLGYGNVEYKKKGYGKE